MNRRTAINLGFFGLVFVVMISWAIGNVVTIDRIERPYTISAEFEAASGILPNAEVAYLGINYGRVTNVDRIPGGVRVTMKVDRGKEIPTGSVARIFRKSAVGEPYIDFQPPEDYEGDGGPFIEAGDTVPMDQTRIPLEFSELLRSASALIGGIDAEQAGTVVHELALALAGRADSLRSITVSSDQLMAEFAARTDVLDRLATNSTRLTSVVADHRTSLGTSLTNLSLVAESLRNANGDTQILLDRGTQFVGTMADLVSDSKANLDCILHDLVPVMQTAGTPGRLAGLTQTLDQAPTAFGNLWNTRDVEADGVWVRVNLLFEFTSPAEQYVPPHALPPVPAVPPCVSALTPVGPDFVPSTVSGQSSGAAARLTNSLRDMPLADTGGVSWLALAGMLVAGAGAVRWLGRRNRHANH